MVSSGTFNNQNVIYDVIALIELGARRCGILPGRLGAEDVLNCQTELQMLINTLIMEGVPLWTIQKYIFGLNINQNLLPLLPEIVDVRNIMYRFNVPPSGGLAFSSAGGPAFNAFDQSLTTYCAQSAPNGNISYAFQNITQVCTVGILPHTTGSLNPIYEYSGDGTNWITAIPAASAPSIYKAGQWYWQDVEQPQSALYFRIRETSGGTLDVTELVFGAPAREINISRNNQDDYQNLPNKNFPGRVLEYWVDRQLTPRLWLWPASQYWLDSLVIWGRREIQDVGVFTNTLEFPQRWLDRIISSLAMRQALIIPGVDPARFPVLQAAEQAAKDLVWTEERDDSPVYIAPEIGAYTRGGR